MDCEHTLRVVWEKLIRTIRMSLYSVTSLAQLTMCVRGVFPTIAHDQPFATMEWGDGFHVEVRKVCIGSSNSFCLEMDAKREDRKAVVWLDLCSSVEGVWQVRDINAVFGMERIREDPSATIHMWVSVPLTSPWFDNHLSVIKTLVQHMFDRVECCILPGWMPNETRDAFMCSVSQTCGRRVRDTLSAAVRVRRARRIRYKKVMRNAWNAWIDHYYDPDTPNGYMDRKIKTCVCDE